MTEDMDGSSRDPIASARRNWENAGWGGPTALGMETVTSIMRAHQIMLGRIEAALRPFQLSFSRFELLRLLAFTRRGELPISKASNLLQVHVSSVTHAIDRLSAARYVYRVPHPTDRRTTVVAITDEGRALVDKATVVLNEVFADLGISDTECVELVGAIRTLRRSYGDF